MIGAPPRIANPGKFIFLLAILWLSFYFLWRELPYVRAGAAVVYSAKEAQERSGQIFPPSVPFSSRLIVFGNSKVLAGFIPQIFDAEMAARTGARPYSANMGKPDESRFVQDLALLAARGQAPRDVLVTLPWAIESAKVDDDQTMDKLFPFRKLPRDLILFSLLSSSRGGPAALYRFGEQAVSAMQQNRGWYFIAGQSHYPGNRLPDEFHLGTDTPDRVDDPAFFPTGPEFQQLNQLAERYDLRIRIVPSYHRTGELAPSPAYAATVAKRLSGWPRFTVAGPNYFLFPARYFSDPVHLNPEGAALYTRQLAGLLTPAT